MWAAGFQSKIGKGIEAVLVGLYADGELQSGNSASYDDGTHPGSPGVQLAGTASFEITALS